MNPSKRSLTHTLAALPPIAPGNPREAIRAAVAANPRHKIVVLDDDPTGTQTVHDIPVLTTWAAGTLASEFAGPFPCFYILTNSRSLAPAAARAVNLEIARNLKSAAGGREFTIISRSDSTLRGYFPLETDALEDGLGPFDATILIPYFEAGKRYTIGDVHYVGEGDTLVPAADTPFARDASFGYSKSNLREWVEEKTAGRVRADNVASISIEELRDPDGRATEKVVARLMELPRGAVCVVNACHSHDMLQFAAAALRVESAGRRLLFRTAAEFVMARIGLEPRPLLTAAELQIPREGGGLIIAGSYVPKTTQQLERLFALGRVQRIELSVDAMLAPERGAAEIARVQQEVHTALSAGHDVAVFTSRVLVTGSSSELSLEIGTHVSSALVSLVRTLAVRPRYLVAKGGITSSDLATRGLGLKRAMVQGQLLPGVPVWRAGDETLFPGLCYVVFPGNVGGPDALVELHLKLSGGE
ncbi:MAG: four-carbon acid sugar kinase family protein [Opitutaceae bacterium]